jgi:hypothetical protein
MVELEDVELKLLATMVAEVRCKSNEVGDIHTAVLEAVRMVLYRYGGSIVEAQWP